MSYDPSFIYDKRDQMDAEMEAADVEMGGYLHDGALDAKFLLLASWGRIDGASEEEVELGDMLRQQGLQELKAALGLPSDYPVLPMVIERPCSPNGCWGQGRKTTSK